MKRKLLSLVFILLLATAALAATTVYVTNTGSKYHLSGCRYLKQSAIPMSLEDAKRQGFDSCSVCKPPE